MARRSCPMAEESKFAGTLSRLRKPPKAPREAVAPEPPIPSSPTTGRVTGKRSDPEWGNITILMRKQVKRDVRRRLKDEREGKDISTLVDELLTERLSKCT